MDRGLSVGRHAGAWLAVRKATPVQNSHRQDTLLCMRGHVLQCVPGMARKQTDSGGSGSQSLRMSLCENGTQAPESKHLDSLYKARFGEFWANAAYDFT